ncbi:MAG: lipo-like protein [Pseudomonadales bacterium]|jgi:hypothetical protein|nr:lipo-like protein [Pseudomonadales bacterium]
MLGLRRRLGDRLAEFLTKPRPGGASVPVEAVGDWTRWLRPCDVLLVEGSSRIATAIKYLTTSTWSHAALCIATDEDAPTLDEGRPATLVEADVRDGVRAVAPERYVGANVRICRPVALTEADRRRVVAHVRAALGHRYDLRNVLDLARYLLPEPPVPARFRRRLLVLGSGEPTRAICSTLIARAFQEVRYPILPEPVAAGTTPRFRPRHHSFVTPRDFDLSPFFAVVKPTLEAGFDPRRFAWSEEAAASRGDPEGAGAGLL